MKKKNKNKDFLECYQAHQTQAYQKMCQREKLAGEGTIRSGQELILKYKNVMKMNLNLAVFIQGMIT